MGILIVDDSVGAWFRGGVLQLPEGRIPGLRQIGTFGSLRMFEFGIESFDPRRFRR